jgi:hypothetical protein
MFGPPTQNHSDGKDNKIKRIFYDFFPLGIYESYPYCIRQWFRLRRGVNLGRETPDEPYPFVLPAGGQELLKGCPSGLNIYIEKGGLYLRIWIANRFDQSERIGATDLRAIQVSNGLITASHTLEKSYGFWKFSIGRPERAAMKSKDFIEVFGGDHIFESAVSIFYFLGGIKGIDSCSDHNSGSF